eukprot:TRINITY_DN44460_c0_g1_i1.p1 TRINITY_DN44460_c0_g1~~TRINITY_DN44460_c0_g1_i1.p1  ORF type:complete len:689 (-),score=75.01 TRINITY_DN44460_c0_g1_i1:31-2097(-)
MERLPLLLAIVVIAACIALVSIHDCMMISHAASNEEEQLVAKQTERPHYWHICHGGDVIASLASSLPRAGAVPLVLNALLQQRDRLDCIVAVLNSYDSVPSWFPAGAQLAYFIPKSDLGASGVFFDKQLISKYKYHLTADDNIVYPVDYSQRMKAVLQANPGHLVGAQCRNVSWLARGALAWFGSSIKYDAPLAPQLRISADMAEPLFAAYWLDSRDIAEFQKSFGGGPADLLGTGTLAYEVSTLQWTLDDVPPPGLVADFNVATLALKQRLALWCIDRRENWLHRIPNLGALQTQRTQPDNQQVVTAALQLDILYTETSSRKPGRVLEVPTVIRDSTREEITVHDGLLPLSCVPYQAARHEHWECRGNRHVEIDFKEKLWQVRLNETLAGDIIAASAHPPAIRQDCRTVHVVVPIGGATKAEAIARSVLSAAYQLYPCILIWLVIDEWPGGESPTYERLMDTTCRKSAGPMSPAFTSIKGIWKQDVTVGCVHVEPGRTGRDRGGGGYGKFVGYKLASKYAMPTDVVITLNGEDQLIHPQALTIVAGAYSQRGCWSTWGSMKAQQHQRGPLPRSAKVSGESNQARPRRAGWVYPHPRSFLAKLFGFMNASDFQDERGNWLVEDSDKGVVFRMIELSGADRACYLEVPLYGYCLERQGGRFAPVLSQTRKDELRKYFLTQTPSDRLLDL